MLKVVVLEGEGALNNITLEQAKDPVVRIEDDDGRPVPNATVTFVLPAMGASGVFGGRGTTYTATTDASGVASARNLRPNNVAGPFQIRVTASSRGNSATALINQTNAAPRRAEKRKSKKLAILILALAGGGGAATALALRGGGSQAATASPITAGGGTVIVPGTPVFGPPR